MGARTRSSPAQMVIGTRPTRGISLDLQIPLELPQAEGRGFCVTQLIELVQRESGQKLQGDRLWFNITIGVISLCACILLMHFQFPSSPLSQLLPQFSYFFSFFFFLRFFHVDRFQSLLNLLQHFFCFMFWFLDLKQYFRSPTRDRTCIITLALAGKALTTGPPGKFPYFFFYTTLFSLYLTLFSEQKIFSFKK